MANLSLLGNQAKTRCSAGAETYIGARKMKQVFLNSLVRAVKLWVRATWEERVPPILLQIGFHCTL